MQSDYHLYVLFSRNCLATASGYLVRLMLALRQEGGFEHSPKTTHLRTMPVVSRSLIFSLGVIEGEKQPLPHAGLNLEVDDLYAAVREPKAAGATVLKIREAGGGVPVRLAEVCDHEGNGFQLRQFVGLPE